MNVVHNLTLSFFKIHFNFVLTCTCTHVSLFLFRLGFPAEDFKHFVSSIHATCPSQSQPSWCDHANNIWWKQARSQATLSYSKPKLLKLLSRITFSAAFESWIYHQFIASLRHKCDKLQTHGQNVTMCSRCINSNDTDSATSQNQCAVKWSCHHFAVRIDKIFSYLSGGCLYVPLCAVWTKYDF